MVSENIISIEIQAYVNIFMYSGNFIALDISGSF